MNERNRVGRGAPNTLYRKSRRPWGTNWKSERKLRWNKLGNESVTTSHSRGSLRAARFKTHRFYEVWPNKMMHAWVLPFDPDLLRQVDFYIERWTGYFLVFSLLLVTWGIFSSYRCLCKYVCYLYLSVVCCSMLSIFFVKPALLAATYGIKVCIVH